MKYCTLSFPKTSYPPMSLPAHTPLADRLTVQNSPVLFGCRTGICGTCLVRVAGEIPPPQADEREVLEAIAPHLNDARLACQIDLTVDLAIVPF
jgi:ferredoxin